MTAGVDFASYVKARRATIDRALERFLPAPPECPPIVAESMRYSVFAGGKRLRPILALASAEAVADHPDVKASHPSADRDPISLATPLACAIELIHTYSLIHDDLPAMDDDELRRGRPTAHVVFGEGIAILAGDGLLTEAFRILADHPAGDDELARRKLRSIALVARAAGAEGMVGGQAIDLEASGGARRTALRGQGDPLDHDGLRRMHARKTGALIRAAVAGGAIMAGATDPLVAAVDAYGAELGLAFQIVDDILDVEGAPEEIGKTVGKDAAAGKATYPALYGLEESRRLARECIERARGTLAAAGLRGQLDALADWVVARTS